MKKNIIELELVDSNLELIRGLPRNWEIQVKDRCEDETRYKGYDEEGYFDCYTLDHTQMLFGSSMRAVILSDSELGRLHKHLDHQVKIYGRRNFTSILKVLEKCLGD